jgi:hypothetical protein
MCQKCGHQLWQSREPDYGDCLIHGPQYLYTPLEYVEASELPGEPVEAIKKPPVKGAKGVKGR